MFVVMLNNACHLNSLMCFLICITIIERNGMCRKRELEQKVEQPAQEIMELQEYAVSFLQYGMLHEVLAFS